MAKSTKTPKQLAEQRLKDVTLKIATQNKGDDADYAKLQYTWNEEILERSFDYIPKESKKMIGIGTFMGALEIALSENFETVVCVDHKSYLPKWKPKNLVFHKANIDAAGWKLPSARKKTSDPSSPLAPDERYDVCYFIETIEHLLWSPLPLLKWVHANSHLFVISTPDDAEWPAMEIHPWSRYQHFSSIPAVAPGLKGNPKPMFHTKQYTQTEFIEILDFVGFRVLEFFRTGDGKHQMVAICQPR